MERPHGPLAGIRVLDLTGQIGQPVGRYLADLAADVVLIEPPGGTPTRLLAPVAPAQDGGTGRSTFFLHFNSNKRSAVIDLEEADGRETFLRLVRGADAVIESFNPGYMASVGLGFEQLELRGALFRPTFRAEGYEIRRTEPLAPRVIYTPKMIPSRTT